MVNLSYKHRGDAKEDFNVKMHMLLQKKAGNNNISTVRREEEEAPITISHLPSPNYSSKKYHRRVWRSDMLLSSSLPHDDAPLSRG